jgi:hypothetical protein
LFGRERSTPDPRRIRLDDPNNLLDNSRWDTQPRTDPSDRGGRGSDVRISPIIEVEHEGVGAFDEDAFVLLDGFVQEGRAVDDVRAEALGEFLRKVGVFVHPISGPFTSRHLSSRLQLRLTKYF